MLVRIVKPSETKRGRDWLTNFLPEDQGAARELIDSIMFVRQSTIRLDLLQHLNALVDDGVIQMPALLVPALSIEDINDSLGLTRAMAPRYHVAYESYEVGAPISALPGSEGFIGNLVRELTRQRSAVKRGWIAPRSSLDDVKAACCRTLVIVTDYSGSGEQLVEFAKTFTRNPTIRSWRSGVFLKIHAVAYTATTAAIGRLNAQGSAIDSCSVVRTAPTFLDRPWDAELRRSIEEMCVRKSKSRSLALGYKGSKALFATEASAPNNLPYVLRQTGKRWLPFFEERVVPSDLASELGEYIPRVTNTDLAGITKQRRLSESLNATFSRPSTVDLLNLLALIGRGRRDRHRLAAATAQPLIQIDALITSLQRLQLIDGECRVTHRGRAELRSGKAAQRKIRFELPASDGDYYPRGMR